MPGLPICLPGYLQVPSLPACNPTRAGAGDQTHLHLGLGLARIRAAAIAAAMAHAMVTTSATV